MRKNVALPPAFARDRGAMATVYADGGYGYAATGDTSPAGLAAALERAAAWARATRPLRAGRLAHAAARRRRAASTRRRRSTARCVAPRVVDLLMDESRAAPGSTRGSSTGRPRSRCGPRRIGSSPARAATSSSAIASCSRVSSVTAHADGDTQTRTLNGYRGICQQGGDEILERFGFVGAGRRIAEEALELLAAPNCPTGTMDVLLMPDQMILQIHESIGHPLELDRILGDERNFAGTSFVTPDMFGTYRYGSRAAQRHVRPDARARSSRATAATTTARRPRAST